MRLAWLAAAALLAVGCGDTTSNGGDMSGGSDMAMAGGDMATFGPAPCTKMTDYMAISGTSTTVMFGGALGDSYSPKCLSVKTGTTVTWMGDFTSHPLRPSTRGTTGNPIMATSSGTSTSFTFGAVGFFPWFCLNHGSDSGAGMSGVVQVTN
jgi:plastocyanin